MKKYIFVFVALSIVLALLGTSCSSSDTASDSAPSVDGAALVAERCGECHAADLVKSVSLDAAGWQANVERMVRKGAELSDEEAKIVIDYLSENYAQ
jgi:mono/diheme cytochrome c family protein